MKHKCIACGKRLSAVELYLCEKCLDIANKELNKQITLKSRYGYINIATTSDNALIVSVYLDKIKDCAECRISDRVRCEIADGNIEFAIEMFLPKHTKTKLSYLIVLQEQVKKAFLYAIQ